MNLSNKNSRRDHGNLMLALVALLAIVAICYFGYKIIDRLMKHPIDPNHGQGTNVVDTAWSGQVQTLKEQGVTSVAVPEFNVMLPVDALAYQWHYTVETSTNLTDWTEVDRELPTLDELQTNHAEPMRFWRRQIWW